MFTLPKSTHLIVFLCYALLCFSNLQAQVVSDDFSDGDFSSNPAWEGSTAQFSINAAGELQLTATDAGQSELRSTFPEPTDLNDKEWRFKTRQSFSGSSNNYGRIYLAFEGDNLLHDNDGQANGSGYYLQLGEALSNDAVRLYFSDGTTQTEICAGMDGQISGSFEWNLRVRRDAAGNWSLWADSDAGEDFVLLDEGNYVDPANLYTQLGWVCTYTSSNADNFFLDDVYFGDWIVDMEPPTLLSTTVLNSNQIELVFSEDMAASAEEESNYTLSTLGNPTMAQFSEGNNTVTLSYANILPANTELTLTISGLSDVEGNPLAETDVPIFYAVFPPVAEGELIFNEIMADPTPVVALPEVEWVEIKNTRSEAIDLSTIIFVNSETEIPLPDFVLEANAQIVLCANSDVEALSDFGSAIGLSSFPALSNSADSLTLKRSDQSTIDIVSYTSAWYQDLDKDDGGYTLERINPDTPCSGAGNWAASQAPSGGTPFESNSIENTDPDTTAPEVVSVTVMDESTISVVFSEELGTFTIGNYQINSNEIGGVNANGNTVLLQLDNPLELGLIYTLTIEEAADCSANTMLPFSTEIILGAMPQAGDLILTEIMADPSPSQGLPAAEYVEVYNASDQYLDLGQLLLQENEADAGFVLAPNAYATLLSDESSAGFLFLDNRVVFSGLSSTTFTNSGSTILLQNSAGEILDEVSYDLSWYQDPDKADGGFSLERINLDDPCSDASNWAASTANNGGTPSAENSILDNSPDQNPPTLATAIAQDAFTILLTFNEPIALAIEDFVFEADGLELSNVQTLPSNVYQYLLTFSTPLQEGVIYTATVSGIIDCWGNASDSESFQIGLPQMAEPGDVVINEILSDPSSGCIDFIEVYNRSSKIIDLQGWALANGSLGMMEDIEIMSETPLFLFPNKHLALSEDASTVAFCNPTPVERFLATIPNMPPYSNAEGEVYLLTPDLETMDQVSYTDDWHFDLLDSTDGISLERVAYDADSNDPNNWHSAAESVGFATAGYVNSQSVGIGVVEEQIEVTQEIFSPNSDGYQDLMLIAYQLDQAGFVANVEVFDQLGRPVKKLADNELLGASGIWQWDGTRQEGDRAGVGPYLIYIQLFDLEGNTAQFKRTCVLATQL